MEPSRGNHIDRILYGFLVHCPPVFPLYIGIDLNKIAKPDLLCKAFFVIEDQVTTQECLFDLSAKCLAQVWRHFVFEFERLDRNLCEDTGVSACPLGR